uniref:Scavenger receptor class F member 1-like n=1 Tax=Crassostrea virginica TaxID=6565 RepID=A0A8B8ABR0_CRAVI|nr:scavenger receptor class F member 1-like [Crassostrea virginica]
MLHVILFLFINIDKVCCISHECEIIRNNGCCDGYFRDSTTKSCEKCIPGYLGPDCALSCPYPSYGERCQGHCNCINTSCDVSIGCKPMGIELETMDAVMDTSGTAQITYVKSASQGTLDQTVLYHVLILHMVRDAKDTVTVVTQAVMFLLDVKL